MAFYGKSILKSIGNEVLKMSIRKYPRWSHRTPKRVILPHEYNEELDAKDPKEFQNNIVAKDFDSVEYDIEKRKEIEFKAKAAQEEKLKQISSQKKKSPSKKITTDMLETIIDKDGSLIYTKLKDNDYRIGNVLIKVKSKQFRDKNDLILLEGKRLIKEALEKKCQLKYLVFSRHDEVNYLMPFLPKMGAKIYKMPYEEMQMWSNLTTCPGIMGFFKTPNTEEITPPKEHLPLTVICDNIREPGNLGAIIRCSAALPCEKIILANGCVDLWNTKVTRSSSGSHFTLPIFKRTDWNKIYEMLPPSTNVYIADVLASENGKQNVKYNSEQMQMINSMPLIPYYSVDYTKNKHNVIVIGGETEGLSEDTYRFARICNGVRVNIPMHSKIDSLNAGTALGIIMFELKRQLLTKLKVCQSQYV